MKLFCTVAAFAALSLTALRPAAAQTTVYSNNFTNGAGAGWSSQKTDTTPGTAAHAADAFLGQFANQTVTLGLNNLAAHSSVTVGFDLYMIRSMDGNGQFGGGADPWSFSANGQSLISTNFANFPSDTQGFGGSNGTGGYITTGNFAPQTGATEANTLGYTFGGPEDAVYHLAFTFNDAASALAFSFASGQTEDINNESWGLDNVVVQTNASPNSAPVPEASTVVSLSLLLALGAGSLTVRARRRKPSAA